MRDLGTPVGDELGVLVVLVFVGFRDVVEMLVEPGPLPSFSWLAMN